MFVNINILLTLTVFQLSSFELSGEKYLFDIALTGVQCGLKYFSCNQVNYGDLFIYCFSSDGKSTKFIANAEGARQFKMSPLYKRSHKLVIYVHGFGQSSSCAQTESITRPFLTLSGVMFCAVNGYDAFSFSDYIRAARNTKCVGAQVANFLCKLSRLGFKPEKVHVVGHSLGGQTCGFIGRAFQRCSGGFKVGRLTALDPAGPCFYPLVHNYTVSPDDATCVDAYHCNGGVYGSLGIQGHADFYPNCGILQTGCMTSLCSHGDCVVMFAKSIAEQENCLAVECSSCLNFIEESGFKKSTRVGYYWNGTPGIYYYYTNSDFPLYKGVRGILGGINEFLPRKNMLKSLFGL